MAQDGDQIRFTIGMKVPWEQGQRIDEVRLAQLKRSVSLYRLAFGQLRQADLVDFLGSHLDQRRIDELSRAILLNLQLPDATLIPGTNSSQSPQRSP
jgi:hypothetical protein